MDFTPSAAARDHLARAEELMAAAVHPAEPVYAAPAGLMHAAARALRIVDGPDAVHVRSVARRELSRYMAN